MGAIITPPTIPQSFTIDLGHSNNGWTERWKNTGFPAAQTGRRSFTTMVDYDYDDDDDDDDTPELPNDKQGHHQPLHFRIALAPQKQIRLGMTVHCTDGQTYIPRGTTGRKPNRCSIFSGRHDYSQARQPAKGADFHCPRARIDNAALHANTVHNGERLVR